MIRFRDRALKVGEKSHYYCDKCGWELHPDLAYSHKCVIRGKISQLKEVNNG